MLVGISVHRTEFKEVEYLIVTSYSLGFVDNGALLSNRIANAVNIRRGERHNIAIARKEYIKVRFHKGNRKALIFCVLS